MFSELKHFCFQTNTIYKAECTLKQGEQQQQQQRRPLMEAEKRLSKTLVYFLPSGGREAFEDEKQWRTTKTKNEEKSSYEQNFARSIFLAGRAARPRPSGPLGRQLLAGKASASFQYRFCTLAFLCRPPSKCYNGEGFRTSRDSFSSLAALTISVHRNY